MNKTPEYIRELHDLYQIRAEQQPDKAGEYALQLAKQIKDLIKS